MLVTPETQKMIKALSKAKLNKYLKWLSQGEVITLREIWLFCDSFDSFVKYAQNEVPMSQQDYYIANVYFERHWNIPDTHTLK